jgi:hypothetical protein
MPEQQSQGELVNELLSQDKGISESQFEEVRMKIEQILNKANQQEKWVRRAILVAVCVLFLSYAAAILLKGHGPRLVDWVTVAWGLCVLGSLICTTVFSLLYFIKYRPAVSRTRNELHTTILSDLQRQVAELAKRLDKVGK